VLVWTPGQQPFIIGPAVQLQEDLDEDKFYRDFVESMIGPTRGASIGNTIRTRLGETAYFLSDR
jgi:hypothetical protein